MISLDSLLIPVHHKQVALFRLHDDMLAKTRHLHPGLTNEGGGGDYVGSSYVQRES